LVSALFPLSPLFVPFHSERFFGSFSRSIRFPQTVDVEHSQAKYENGILRLLLPKKQSDDRRTTVTVE
jgi:HSP20 family protein